MAGNNTSLSRLQTIIAVVVSVGWLAVVVLPAFIPEWQIHERVQTSVMGAMMAILGAVFGIALFKKNGGGGE